MAGLRYGRYRISNRPVHQDIFHHILTFFGKARVYYIKALQFAAALVSLKLETPGPFRGTMQDVLAKMTAQKSD